MKSEVLQAVHLCITGHSFYSKKPEFVFRKWDGKTPYWAHPLWCAMTFLQETNLPFEVDRTQCFLALIFHDWIENTTSQLPLPKNAPIDLIQQMTFSSEPGSTEIEIREIWSKPPIIRLLKLYDKVSNLLDGSWMSDEKWNRQYVPYVLRLADDVEENYGDLNIVRMARAVAIPRLIPNTRA